MISFVTDVPHWAENYTDWISSSKPEWYKKFSDTSGARTWRNSGVLMCPHFVELFNNSYVIKAPTDIILSYNSNGGFNVDTPLEPEVQFISCDSHQMYEQLDKKYGEVWVSFKLKFRAKMMSDKPEKIMIMDTFSYQPQAYEIKPIQGILPLTNQWLETNINFVAEKHRLGSGAKYMIEAGMPLCVLYFPNGKPKLNVKPCTSEEYAMKYVYMRKKFFGDYWRRFGGVFK